MIDPSLPEQLLAMLDSDSQGWVCARAVRENGVIVDFEVVYINEAGCRLVGRQREDLIGGRYRQLWPETVNDGTLPFYCAVVETATPATRTVYYERPSITGHFELRAGPYGDGMLVRFVNLRQVTVAPQSDGGTQLYDMLDTAFDGFTVLRPMTGPNGRIVDFRCEYVNQLGAKLAGRAAEDVIGHMLSDISPESWDNGLFDRYEAVASTGEPWRQQLSYPEVEQVWEVKISRADRDAVVVSFREITEHIERQRQLTESAVRAEHAAARARALESATAALVAASTTAQVYAAIGAVLRPSAGGQGLIVLLRRDDTLRLTYHAGYEPDVIARLQDLPLDDPYPATAVARTGQASYLTCLAQFHAAQPDPATAVSPGNRQAWALLPLAVAGDVLGVLVVGYREPRDFDDDTRSTLMALAGLTAQALQRAMLYETSLSIAAELQHALLPASLPTAPGLRHAARYLPWTRGAEVGGDWYDLIATPDGRIAVVIGDVAGHNVSAAAAMGQIRDALRAYAIAGLPPHEVMNHTHELIRTLGLDTIATCCYIRLNLTDGTATAVLAGHPPPILRTDKATTLLPLPTQPPLGSWRHVTYRATDVELPNDATLLLYTDGLVEDARHPIDQGMQELCDAVRAAPSSDPAQIIDHVLAGDVGPQPRSDDIAVLCLTREDPAER